jgi:hypothetical protein
VAENIFSFDAKFWMRIATRNDSLKSEADKDKLKAVADTVMVLVDAMVKQTEQQLNDSAAVLQVGGGPNRGGTTHAPTCLLMSRMQLCASSSSC